MVVHDLVVSRPRLETAVRVIVCSPVWLVSIGTVPLGLACSPEYASEAVTVALALLASRVVAGHAISRLGGVASTCTVRQPGAETFPTLSATVPHAACEPLVLIV